MPLVSVIVPIFNAEGFVEETIVSVIEQTFPDWELLLVDDGSTDRSASIARQYVDEFPGKIRCVTHEANRNLGVSASRNLGLRVSRGEYVAFVDADDVWLPEHLATYVEMLQRHPGADLAFGRTIYWHSWDRSADGSQQHADYAPPLGRLKVGTSIPAPEVLSNMLLGTVAVPCTCSLTVRRNAIIDVGGFEDSFPGAYEDQVIYAKLLLNCSAVATDDCLDLYRQHGQSMSARSRNRETEAAERRRFLEWLSSYLDREHVSDRELWNALNVAKWRLEHPSLNRWRSKLSRYLDPMFIVRLLSEKSGSGMSPLAPNVER